MKETAVWKTALEREREKYRSQVVLVEEKQGEQREIIGERMKKEEVRKEEEELGR